MPTDKPEQELIKVADLIVGLRNTLTERQRDLDLASKAIKDRDATLAEKNEQIGNLTAELEAMRRGIDAYRLASSKDSASVRQWEDAVGSLIWPLKFSTVVCHPQQPWHLGEVPLDLTSVPGIEWETEIKSGDIWTTTGFLGGEPTARHRPTNLTWEAVYKLAASYLGKTHCISGHPRLEDSQIAAWFGPGKYSQATANACIDYHTAYSQTVEFLRPSAVTVAATTKAANLCSERREYLKPLYEAPEIRPFRFVDIMGRPISWTLLDPKMPASGAEPKASGDLADRTERQVEDEDYTKSMKAWAEAWRIHLQKSPGEAITVNPGTEYRPGLRPKIFEKLTDIIWDDQRTPHFASRPVNATWAEVQRRAAEILGREDCLAGRERLTTEGVYDAVGMTHEDRAKTDGAAVAYQKAYSDAVVRLRDDDLTFAMRTAAQRRGAIKWHEAADPMSPFCYADPKNGLPISWRVLDPSIVGGAGGTPDAPSLPAGAVHKATTLRGSTDALAVLMKIFARGPRFCPGNEDSDYIPTLGQDALIRQSPDGNYMITALGRLILAEELKHLLAALS